MGRERKYKLNQKKRRVRERNRRNREKELALSEDFKQKYQQEINEFEKRFIDIDVCKSVLWKWKRWILKRNILKFECPMPSCDSTQAYVYKKKNHGKMVDKYQCCKCKKQVSLTSDTIFKNTKTSLWIWFLSLYSMALLDGKVPVTFLRERAQEYERENGIDRHVSKQNMLRITDKLKKKVFSQPRGVVDTYRDLVGLARQRVYKNFLEWYDASPKNKHSWKTGWRLRIHNADNKIANEIAAENNLEKVDSALYCKKQVGVQVSDWILCFNIKKKPVSNISWLHVSCLKPLSPAKGPYYHQVLQVTEKEDALRRPFIITNKFRKAFAKSIEIYGVKKFKQFSENNIAIPPIDLLDNVAKRLGGAY